MRILIATFLILSFLISSFTITHASECIEASGTSCQFSDGTLNDLNNHHQGDAEDHCFHCHFFTYNLVSNDFVIYSLNKVQPVPTDKDEAPHHAPHNLYRPPIA